MKVAAGSYSGVPSCQHVVNAASVAPAPVAAMGGSAGCAYILHVTTLPPTTASTATAASSVRLRDGDPAAVAAYDRHGRIRDADEETAYDRAASMWLADHLRGKDVLLLAGSNAEAAELSRRVQARLAAMGRASLALARPDAAAAVATIVLAAV